MSEHILWETIKERNEQIEELTKENKLAKEHYNQLLNKIAELEQLNSNQAENLRITMLEEEKKGKQIADLEQQIATLGERCNQLLKDKGDLTDKIADIKANCDLAIEGRDVKRMELEKQVKDLEWQLQEVAKDNDYYQAENKILEEKIEDFKDYVLKVSKFLHNNNNTRPDKLVYKERDILLIKKLKLFEKWELKE